MCAGRGVPGLHQEAPYRVATFSHTHEEDTVSFLEWLIAVCCLLLFPVTVPCHSKERWFWFWVVREIRSDGDLAPAAVREAAQKWLEILF